MQTSSTSVKRKLLFINDALKMGGVEMVLFSLLHQIDYNRFSVDVLIWGKIDDGLISQIDSRAK